MAVIADWSTAALKKQLLGKRVRIIGWLFDDLEHKAEAEKISILGARRTGERPDGRFIPSSA